MILQDNLELFPKDVIIDIPIVVDEFWTSKQRQGHSLHEISYRACFKPQLPKYFIEKYSKEGDVVYDPFTGRGTTIIEAGLLGRKVISNDINPLSRILCESRLNIPTYSEVEQRLQNINFEFNEEDYRVDLEVFFHQETLKEIIGFRDYFRKRKEKNIFDNIDFWIQMVATNRLTGHSNGFFSVYTLPPNQAVSIERQQKINESRNQKPEYRDTKKLILKKTKTLLKDVTIFDKKSLKKVNETAMFLTEKADETYLIKSDSVDLTITSPPFLDVIKYDDDNWLRCWFNNIDIREVGKKITMSRSVEEWKEVMFKVFKELYRITKIGGIVAFEVGEVRNGKIKLDEISVELGIKAGFSCECIMINQQEFSKTSNIWGVKNNSKGTNTNRIVILRK